MPAGRPTVWNDEFTQKACGMYANGATDFEVADELGIGVRSLYKYLAAKPEFRQATQQAKEICDDRVENSLYARAVGMTYKSVKIFNDKGTPMVVPHDEYLPPSESAAQFWLKNRRAGKWRDKQEIDLKVNKFEKMTEEELQEFIATEGQDIGSEE